MFCSSIWVTIDKSNPHDCLENEKDWYPHFCMIWYVIMMSLCFSVYRRHKLCHLEWSYQTGLIRFRSLRCKNWVMFHHYVSTEFGTWRSIENSTMSWVTGGTMQPAGGRPGWSEVGGTEEEVPGQDLLSENREVGEKAEKCLTSYHRSHAHAPSVPPVPFWKRFQ